MEMLEDRDKIRRFGKAGRARVRDMFDFQKMISKTETVYTDCIDRRNVL
jgi:glycosyltransferase involved in cell wall biosynthesis